MAEKCEALVTDRIDDKARQCRLWALSFQPEGTPPRCERHTLANSAARQDRAAFVQERDRRADCFADMLIALEEIRDILAGGPGRGAEGRALSDIAQAYGIAEGAIAEAKVGGAKQ